MHRFVPTAVFVFLALSSAPLRAGQPAKSANLIQEGRFSPHDTISKVVEGDRITIVYGRPYSIDPWNHKPRKIWGELVPYDKIWRVGADEATLFITQHPIQLGGTEVPAGAYTLFMLPAADGSAKLIVNKEIGQWGIDPYHTELELARIPLHHAKLAAAVPEFTITIQNGKPDGGVIKFAWEETVFSVPFVVRR